MPRKYTAYYFIKEPDHFILMIKSMFGKENIR